MKARFKAHMISVAKQEIREWKYPNGVALAVLFCFIERLTTGQTVEELFFKRKEPTTDYEI